MAETHNVYVIIGNSALFKCEIPSFVADFVTIDSWNDNDGSQYFSAITNNHGKPNQRKCIFLLQEIAVHHKNTKIGDKIKRVRAKIVTGTQYSIRNKCRV